MQTLTSIDRIVFRTRLKSLYSKYPRHVVEPVSRQLAEVQATLQQETVSLECVAAMLAHQNYLYNKNS